MELLKLMEERYSVRKYLAKPVEEEKKAAILEAARLAPSAKNNQPIKIKVVTGDELAKLSNSANAYGAPLVFIVCADKDTAWERQFDGKQSTDIDASIVTDHMMLESASLGLGSVWICWFDPEKLRSDFNIPDNLVPVNILAVGYTDGDGNRRPKTRKSLEDILL